MSRFRTASVGVALGTAMVAAGAFGYVFFSPASSSAQTSTTVPAAAGTASTTVAGIPHSNEDPTHEKGENTQREADEASGKAFSGAGHDGTFTPNTDPAHEKSESAAHAAQENAGQMPTAP